MVRTSSLSGGAVKSAGYIPGGKDYKIDEYRPWVAEWHKPQGGALGGNFYHYHTLKKKGISSTDYVRVNDKVHAFFGLPFLGDPIGGK